MQSKGYTHVTSSGQYDDAAYFNPTETTGHLHFQYVDAELANAPTNTYAVYHGRLIEAFISHFAGDFETAVASVAPSTWT
ncbi:MAG: hypothetical protein EON58_18025 [Alphaproteobacteria bacterium]|nr:MAG: hypothetical protein EON58_18025 [Alphaproteobacteria bacterium]